MKIVLAGPPRSGKSCLREGLKQAVRQIPGAPYPYVITACPDGEGAWFQQTVSNDPELAAQCKAAYKAKFTPAFTNRIEASVKNCQERLVLVDIGGIVSDENRQICRHADSAILIAGDSEGKTWEERLVEWKLFCKALDLKVIALLHSDYNGTEDQWVTVDDRLLVGSVHHLERGEPLADRETIRELARHAVRLEASHGIVQSGKVVG